MVTQSLNFRGRGIRFLLGVFGLNFTSNNEISHIVLLCQIEKLANLARSLGTETFRVRDVGEPRDFSIALFDNGDGEDGKIGTNDAAADRFAFAFSITAGAVAGVAFGE